MMNRYRVGGLPATFFSQNVLVTEGADFQEVSTTISGVPAAVVVVKLTTLTLTNGSGYYQLNGTNHVLNDTVSLTIGSNGTVTFTQYLKVGTTAPGNVARSILTIESTTIGGLGSPLTNQNSYTT